MRCRVSEEMPSAREYCELRAACGLGKRTIEAAEIALQRSLFAVSIRDESNALIGMGRVVGDLGCHVQVVDIAIHPTRQKEGLSRQVMTRVMSFIRANVPECAYVNLFADVDYLYQKYGFAHPISKGMFLDRSAPAFNQ